MLSAINQSQQGNKLVAQVFPALPGNHPGGYVRSSGALSSPVQVFQILVSRNVLSRLHVSHQIAGYLSTFSSSWPSVALGPPKQRASYPPRKAHHPAPAVRPSPTRSATLSCPSRTPTTHPKSPKPRILLRQHPQILHTLRSPFSIQSAQIRQKPRRPP